MTTSGFAPRATRSATRIGPITWARRIIVLRNVIVMPANTDDASGTTTSERDRAVTMPSGAIRMTASGG